MNKLNAIKSAQPLSQAVPPVAAPAPVAAQPAPLAAKPAPVQALPAPTFTPDAFVATPAPTKAPVAAKPAAPAPARTLGQKVWDGVKKGLFVGTLSAPLVGVAIFGAVGTMLGLSSLAAAAVGTGAWLVMTAGAGALWGSKQ